jgi:hypothetical protein
MPRRRDRTTVGQPRQPWRAWEVEFLRLHYAENHTEALAAVLGRAVERVLAKANALGLHKSRACIAAVASERVRSPGHGGQAHQFKPGLVPWNKGSHFKAGGRSAETRFKPGSKPHTWQPVGSYRIVVNKNGGPQLERKVNDLPGPTSVRWHPVHRLVWEAANGAVPPGHIVVFRPGRRSTELALITEDAVECISRQELMRRNTVHNYGPQVAEIARLRGVLNRVINSKARKAQEPAP